MDLFTLFLVLAGIVIGFLIGKHIYDKVKWSDKRAALDAEWKLKIETLDGKYKNQILEIQKNNQITVEQLAHKWELKYTSDLSEIKELLQSAEKYMRYDAIKRSKRTLLGKLWEQVSPYLPKFPFRPSDMKFLGSPIDFVIFDGASENDIKQVIFLEVKTGDSKLSAQERKLKQAIEEGKVSWKLFNVEKPDEVIMQELEEKEEMEDEIAPHEIYENIDEKIKSVRRDEEDADESDEEEKESASATGLSGYEKNLKSVKKILVNKFGDYILDVWYEGDRIKILVDDTDSKKMSKEELKQKMEKIIEKELCHVDMKKVVLLSSEQIAL